MNYEPEIIINGQKMGVGCSMTIRVALEVFANYLIGEAVDDVLGKELNQNYWNRIEDVRRAMGLYSCQANEKN